jgi:hypothetical protein
MAHALFVLQSSNGTNTTTRIQSCGFFSDYPFETIRGRVACLDSKATKASKRLGDANELLKFAELCANPFGKYEKKPPAPVRPRNSQAEVVDVSQSPLKTKQESRCTPHCQSKNLTLKRKLEEVSDSVKQLKKKLKVPNWVKNQAVSRLRKRLEDKENLIKELSDPEHESLLRKLEEKEKEIDLLNASHRRLKH